MGSSNGATRGQLRAYLSGRTPPFLLVGLIVILFILGFSYWSLNSQYNDLQIEILKLQDRLRAYAEKRESVEKMNSALQAQMQTYKEENKKFRITMYKRDQELNTIAEQLRRREDDVNKANSQLESLKSDMEKLEAQDKLKEQEITSLQDQAKSLKEDNQVLTDAKDELQRKLEAVQNAAKSSTRKNSGNSFSNNGLQQDVQADRREPPNLNPDDGIPPENMAISFGPQVPDMSNNVHEEHKVQSPSLNPDDGIPPQNKEMRFGPQVPDMGNSVHEEHKVQTPAPESPDESNIDKLPETTSKVQLNDAANDVEPQAANNLIANV